MKTSHRIIALAVLKDMKEEQLREVALLDARVAELKEKERILRGQLFAIDAFEEVERSDG